MTKQLSLVLLLMLGICAPSSAQGWRNADIDRLALLVNGIVDSSMHAEHIAGAAVIVVQDGRVVMRKGYGLANIERNVAVDPARTLFRVGSISKVFTSMALARLAESRGISLNDPVDKYVGKDLVSNRFSEPVRLWHLMTHTGGFDQIDTGRNKFDVTRRRGLEAFHRNQLRVIRPPGSGASYDTYGASLGGIVIEKISGMPYADYMRARVFEPLGMTRTFVETPAPLRDDLALGYAWLNNEYRAQPYEWYESTPASSIDATPDDMARYMQSLLRDSTRWRTVQYSQAKDFATYSFGLWEDVVNGERILHHGGNMLEYEAEMWMIPAHNAGVFVIYNRDGEAGGPRTALRQTLTTRLMDLWSPATAVVRAKAPLPIDVTKFAGSYGIGVYCHLCVEGEGPVYNYWVANAVAPGTLVVNSDTLFAVDSVTFALSRDASRRISFKLDERGEVAYLFQRNGLRERLGDRLLNEVLGSGWESRPPQTLAARVFRDTHAFAKCADAYQTLAKESSNARAYYYAGQCALDANDPARATAMLQQSWDMNQWRGPTAYLIGIAAAVQGSADSAFEWLTRAKELGSLTGPRLDDRRLASLKADQRWAALAR